MFAGASAFGPDDPAMAFLLVLAGPLTAVPLLFFALAARRLRLSTIGILQFIAPTLQFLVGLAYGEQLTTPRAICFSLIWIAVAVFSFDAWKANRSKGEAAIRPSTQ
jgi:chloramphenicol-sensitive protein RarD